MPGPMLAPKGHATSSRALDHVGNAAGLAGLRRGFAFTPEMDAWFALGWPHFVHLVEGLPIDDVEATTIEFLTVRPAYVPLEIAHGLARVYPRYPRCLQNVRKRGKHSYALDAVARKQLKKRKPIDAAEARKLVTGAFARPRMVLLLEALFGTKFVVDALLDHLEKTSRYEGRPNPAGYRAWRVLYFLLLRLPPRDDKRAVKRLTKLSKAWMKQHPEGLPTASAKRTTLHAILLALGDEGARTWQLGEGDHACLGGNPTWLRKELAKWKSYKTFHGAEPDARRVFLGGAAQLKNELAYWSKYGGDNAHAYIVETYGVIKSPHTVALMVDMLARSKAKRMVKQWFVDHARYARGHLVKLTHGDDKRALASLSARTHHGVRRATRRRSSSGRSDGRLGDQLEAPDGRIGERFGEILETPGRRGEKWALVGPWWVAGAS